LRQIAAPSDQGGEMRIISLVGDHGNMLRCGTGVLPAGGRCRRWRNPAR